MSSCHKNDSEAKVLVAECLGELGAVDPGRLVLSHAFLSLLTTAVIELKLSASRGRGNS